MAGSRAALLLAGLAAGCYELEPCPGAKKGAQFRIEVQEPKDAEMGCQDAWGLGTGSIIEGSIVDLWGDHDCKSGLAEVERVGDWSWTRADGGYYGGYSLQGRHLITNGGCSALLRMELRSEPPGDCDASAGDACELQVRISPRPAAEDCPQSCSGTLLVRAELL